MWCVHPESRIELKSDDMDERQMGDSSDTKEKAVEITPVRYKSKKTLLLAESAEVEGT